MENEQTVNLWSRRWLQAQLDLSDKKADRDAALQAHRERLLKVDEIARGRLDLGGSPTPLRMAEDEMKNYETVFEQFKNSEASPEQVCHASVRWAMAQQKFRNGIMKLNKVDKAENLPELVGKLGEEVGFDIRAENSEFKAHLDRAREVERIATARFEAGRYAPQEQETATFYRLEAEEWLRHGKVFKEDALDPGGPPKD
jgi:hypothetical protein